ncbi:MAG: hypothetical protein JWR10_968 [Rubritepida sp.]|nr:hypothetical protein [Rubritepida sp.]
MTRTPLEANNGQAQVHAAAPWLGGGVIALDIKPDLRSVHRAMMSLGAKQVPFANSVALNALAKGVATTERDEVAKEFETPTPFTVNSMRIEVATKSKPVSFVAVKDIQAEYLEPYVVGGQRALGKKRGMLAPRAVGLNRYGNLTRGKLASLKSKPGVYIGGIRTKAGKVINGVWQRPRPAKAGKAKGGLKLLLQFTDTTEAPKHLAFYERGTAYVRANAAREYGLALQRALATAR